MTIFTPHIGILPSSQQEIWPELSPITQMGFVLYGGTAIALQLAHRFSIDFDFFQAAHSIMKTFFMYCPSSKARQSNRMVSIPFPFGCRIM